jgi:hypothetical protein
MENILNSETTLAALIGHIILSNKKYQYRKYSILVG